VLAKKEARASATARAAIPGGNRGACESASSNALTASAARAQQLDLESERLPDLRDDGLAHVDHLA